MSCSYGGRPSTIGSGRDRRDAARTYLTLHYGGDMIKQVGASPSGKARAFGARIRRFESYRPSREYASGAKGGRV